MPEAKKLKAKFTYSDYLTWPEDERWELIEGVPYDMGPAPTRKHQTILLNIATVFRAFLRGKSCQVFIAPFDVRLTEQRIHDEEVETVVQPDLSVFCDEERLDERGAIGAPDLVVEILSPSTSHKDLYDKLLVYQKYKVKEYIIINPDTEEVSISLLDLSNRYDLPSKYTREDSIQIKTLPGLTIDATEIFAS